MVKLRVEYDKNGCIGAASCVAVDPLRYKLDNLGKADLLGSHVEGNLQILEIETDDPTIFVEGARACPVLIIKVINKETGEILAP
ncbi:MAG: ferredoxin [Candidatus Aenigmarchaeota archaeon]|nr:ferredoxin [Candidatus Aenigmarchaeota archaeon]